MWLLRLVKQGPDRAGMVRVIGSDALRREMRLTVKEKIELVLKQKTRNMNGLDLSSCKHRLLPKSVSRAVPVQTPVIGKTPQVETRAKRCYMDFSRIWSIPKNGSLVDCHAKHQNHQPDDHQKRPLEKSTLLKRKNDISAQLSIVSRRLKD